MWRCSSSRVLTLKWPHLNTQGIRLFSTFTVCEVPITLQASFSSVYSVNGVGELPTSGIYSVIPSPDANHRGTQRCRPWWYYDTHHRNVDLTLLGRITNLESGAPSVGLSEVTSLFALPSKVSLPSIGFLWT